MQDDKKKITSLANKHERVESLMKFVNQNTLKNAYCQAMKENATGVGVEYGKKLDENLDNLLIRMKKFSYFPQPKNHVFSNTNQNRKCAVRAFEDEIVQYVLREILEAIYEVKICKKLAERERLYLEGRPQQVIIVDKPFIKVNIKEFSGNINEDDLVNFLKQDIADKNFIKYIKRFLDSGILHFEKKNVQCESLSKTLIGIYVYHVLNSFMMSVDHKLEGKICMRKSREGFVYLFENIKDAKMTYYLLHKYLNDLSITSKENDFCILTSCFAEIRSAAAQAAKRIPNRNMNKYRLQNKCKESVRPRKRINLENGGKI